MSFSPPYRELRFLLNQGVGEVPSIGNLVLAGTEKVIQRIDAPPPQDGQALQAKQRAQRNWPG